jgi:hypothetical protein
MTPLISSALARAVTLATILIFTSFAASVLGTAVALLQPILELIHQGRHP